MPVEVLKRAALAIALACGASSAMAQAYPAKPIRLVVGFTPGGGVDINARLLQPKLTEYLGQQVVVDNRPGAGTNIANEHVAKSAADGYTLLISTATVAINMSLYKKVPFDTLRDFAPVSLFSQSPNILVVHPSVPAKTVKELVALARARPLANLGPKRSEVMPEIPTMKEAGVSGVEVVVWYGVLVPAATPRDIVNKLAEAVARAARSADTRQRLIDQGAEPVGSTPEEFGKLLREEVARWAEVVKVSGARAD